MLETFEHYCCFRCLWWKTHALFMCFAWYIHTPTRYENDRTHVQRSTGLSSIADAWDSRLYQLVWVGMRTFKKHCPRVILTRKFCSFYLLGGTVLASRFFLWFTLLLDYLGDWVLFDSCCFGRFGPVNHTEDLHILERKRGGLFSLIFGGLQVR